MVTTLYPHEMLRRMKRGRGGGKRPGPFVRSFSLIHLSRPGEKREGDATIESRTVQGSAASRGGK